MTRLSLLAAALPAVAAGYGVELHSSNPAEKCPPLTKRAPPSKVKDLKPVDIRVMGAMGDSITAGFAISNLPLESRAKVYSTGDAANATTVHNFLTHWQTDKIFTSNVAVSGDVVQGMGKQATRLISAIKGSKSVDFENDWKLVTLWIGANNMCPSCKGAAKNTPATYKTELTAALQILEKELPRTLVSIVATPILTSLADAPGVDDHCKTEHILTRVECPCAFGSAEDAAKLNATNMQDNANLFDIAKQFGSDTFAVVAQPGLGGLTIPDWTYLSRFDCFHPSLQAHQQIALGLWQNMFEPVGKKSTTLVPPVPMYCPTDADTIQS